MTMRTHSHCRGFTLIELVLVMALIALLLTLAVPRYFRSIDAGKVKVQLQNIATMRDAIDKFNGDQGRYPETLQELVEKHYLRSVPLDPVSELADWELVPPPAGDNVSGVFDVKSAHPPQESSSLNPFTSEARQ
jgi:general secretion pathway protein G